MGLPADVNKLLNVNYTPVCCPIMPKCLFYTVLICFSFVVKRTVCINCINTSNTVASGATAIDSRSLPRSSSREELNEFAYVSMYASAVIWYIQTGMLYLIYVLYDFVYIVLVRIIAVILILHLPFWQIHGQFRLLFVNLCLYLTSCILICRNTL